MSSPQNNLANAEKGQIFSPEGVPLLKDTTLIGHRDHKIDSESLVTGLPVFTGDQLPAHCLHLKLARSPYAFAKVKDVDKTAALKIPGVVAVYWYRDVPKLRFSSAGQTAPEPSPQDRLILDEYVRYVGDPSVIVVAETAKAAQAGVDALKIDYEELEPVLDPEEALDNPILVHPENPTCFLPQQVGGWDFKRNLVGTHDLKFGRSFAEVAKEADAVVDETFQTTAQAHCMMETYRSFAQVDQHGRLQIVSSTQVPFHAKRQVAMALGISPSKVRVVKPRIGGGFGGKQTSVTEFYTAFAAWTLGQPCYLELTREETFIASNSRHAIKVNVKVAAKKDGTLTGIKIKALSDQGAYGEHAWTTLGHVGRKSMPLYSRLESAEFFAQVVYTNKAPSGAFRGYGAPQGIFAVESAVTMVAEKLGLDPAEVRKKNMVREGDTTTAYGEHIASCTLPQCFDRALELIGYDDFDHTCRRVLPDGRIEAVGTAIAQQGSGIAGVDTSTVAIRLNESGDYTLLMSPTDNGTGVDTILTKMAAEILGCDVSNIATLTADTDVTPYDPGSYASSGTYVTGGAVIKAAAELKLNILKAAAKQLGLPISAAEDGTLTLRDQMIWREFPAIPAAYASPARATNAVYAPNSEQSKAGMPYIEPRDYQPEPQLLMSVEELGTGLASNVQGEMLFGTASHGSPISPPPYMAGAARIILDPATGKVEVKKYVGVVDCGTVISENLARVQVEGGIVQSLGYALSEDVTYNKKGKMRESSFMTYRLPTRCDYGEIVTEFIESYEPTGPFGAKSIGELVSNTPAPAIFGAINAATGGKCPHDLPFTPPKVWEAMHAEPEADDDMEAEE